ncbi:hypothetical protein AAG570_001256, partial [Ranatra chinensis]
DVREELKKVIGKLSQLKNHIQTDKPLDLLVDLDPDLKQWNNDLEKKIEKYGTPSFFNCDWLFAECYLYRKLREIFSLTRLLFSFDPFVYQKSTVLNDSLPKITELIEFLTYNGHLNPQELNGSEKKSALTTLIKNALWANQIDLALSGGSTEVKHHLLNDIDKWNDKILVDDLPKVYPIILSDKTDKVVEYILDNSGYEFLSDLCLADFLVTKCGVKTINFRVKRIPWYVSDVTMTDFKKTISALGSYTHPLCKKLAEKWQTYLDTGVWRVHSDQFWCLGLSYTNMPKIDPILYQSLAKSDLIIFKGDLNYRKLVQDVNWDPTTAFSLSLGKFHPAPLVALRTCKADTIAGLGIGIAEKAAQISENWLVSGEFAVIQFDRPSD